MISPTTIERSRHATVTGVERRPRRRLHSAAAPAVTGYRKVLYYILAALFFVLGALGALLPGLPATPFLLLTSYFLVRCSPRLHALLLRSPIFGSILQDWQQHRAIRTDIKLKAVLVVAIAVATTVYFSGLAIPYSLGIVTLALLGTVVIIRLPSLKQISTGS